MLSTVRARLQGRLLMASMTRSFSSLPAEVEEVGPGDSRQLGLLSCALGARSLNAGSRLAC